MSLLRVSARRQTFSDLVTAQEAFRRQGGPGASRENFAEELGVSGSILSENKVNME